MLFSKLLYWFSRPVVGTYSGTMLRMNVTLREKMPEGPKIIAANHPTTADPFFVAALARHQVFILIKDLLFQVPILGTYLRFSNHIPVKLGQGPQALQTALDYLKDGKTIVIFPEGDLSPLDGGFCAPRTGVARLALLSGAPVIPVGISLNRKRIHSIQSTVNGVTDYGHWYFTGPYNITVGSALYFNGDAENHPYVRAVSGNIMHHIIELARQSEHRMDHGPSPLVNLPASS